MAKRTNYGALTRILTVTGMPIKLLYLGEFSVEGSLVELSFLTVEWVSRTITISYSHESHLNEFHDEKPHLVCPRLALAKPSWRRIGYDRGPFVFVCVASTGSGARGKSLHRDRHLPHSSRRIFFRAFSDPDWNLPGEASDSNRVRRGRSRSQNRFPATRVVFRRDNILEPAPRNAVYLPRSKTHGDPEFLRAVVPQHDSGIRSLLEFSAFQGGMRGVSRGTRRWWLDR